MSSRSPSPPYCGHTDEATSSLPRRRPPDSPPRYQMVVARSAPLRRVIRFRRSTSPPSSLPPAHILRRAESAPPSYACSEVPLSYACSVPCGLRSAPLFQYQGESGLELPCGLPSPPMSQHQEESGLELYSPPRITLIKPKDEEPSSPTSPRFGPPSSTDITEWPTFGSDTEEWQYSDTEEWRSSDAEEDPYFNRLVDDFVTAAEDVRNSMLPDNNRDEEADDVRQSDRFAESALKFYNNDENRKVKYELVSAIASCGIIDEQGLYGHVNFIAKGNQQNSKEELFFAEVRMDENDKDYKTFVPTCVVSLEGVKKVDGLCDSIYDDKYYGRGIPIDAQHCYACGRGLKHPKDGSLYVVGHVACGDYYHG